MVLRGIRPDLTILQNALCLYTKIRSEQAVLRWQLQRREDSLEFT
jgi:hypothetical protein